MRFSTYMRSRVLLLGLGLAYVCMGQTTTPAPASDGQKPADQTPPTPPPAALTTPAMTGPLQAMPPATLDAGPFGKLAVNGVLNGLGLWTGNYTPADNSTQAGLSNGQVFIQKTDGWFQFYLQAGAYNVVSLGVPYIQTDKTVSNYWGAVPVAYAKLQAGKNTSFLVGALPTLIGAEYTFSFENMNVSRGLLWGQENAVTRGVQVNQTFGKFTASISWNDYFYSNRYTAMSGSLAYTNGPHTIAFVGGGNLGQTAFQTLATPVQNNSSIYNVIYTYNKGSWVIQPYYQHSSVPTNPKVGVIKGNSTDGGAILVNHTFKGGFSLPVRFEYLSSSGSLNDPDVVNLMYGAGSKATSFTVTPTYQRGGFFVRGDLSYVHLSDITPGLGFGQGGTLTSQPRAMAEFGFIFGHNLIEGKK